MLKEALETATTIASKSPVAVQGTKISLVYSRDHSVPDSLQQVVRIRYASLAVCHIIHCTPSVFTMYVCISNLEKSKLTMQLALLFLVEKVDLLHCN